jgi:hypothetical protein
MDRLYGVSIFLRPRRTFVIVNMIQLTLLCIKDDNASVASSVETLPENEAILREMLGLLPDKAEGQYPSLHLTRG